jgi:hypothetical protein
MLLAPIVRYFGVPSQSVRPGGRIAATPRDLPFSFQDRDEQSPPAVSEIGQVPAQCEREA